MGSRPKNLKFTVDLVDFKEENIQFTKLIPKAYTEDGYNIDECDYETTCKHWWKYVADNHWQICVDIFCRAKYNNVYIPFYVDVDLVILNEHVWEEINPNK